MYLGREMTPISFPIIAGEIGGRDHTTAMHAERRIRGWLSVDQEVRDEIECISQIIKYRMAKRNERVTA